MAFTKSLGWLGSLLIPRPRDRRFESYLWSQFVNCFGLVALMLRALFLQLKELVHDLYARPSDWWIAGLVIFLLLWAAFRWRAGAEGFG